MDDRTTTVFQECQKRFDSNNNGPGLTSSTKQGKITNFFQVLRAPQKQKSDKEFLYIPADNMTPEELIKAGGRATVNVNETEVALVAHQNKIYAIEPKCPHVGGPLHMGDIEDIPGCGPCIKCPWHSWTFSLTSGRCIAPQNREAGRVLKTYPVSVDTLKNKVKIGFTHIDPKLFNSVPD